MYSAHEYLDYYFVGQPRIKNVISLYLDNIINGDRFNILLRARSGQGKTYLARIMTGYLHHNYQEDCFAFYTSDNPEIEENKLVHVIDEAHLVKSVEYLFDYMDRNKFIFIACTNEYGELSEAFENRCNVVTFADYSREEFIQMTKSFFLKKSIILPDEFYEIVVNSSRDTPRVLYRLSKDLASIFRRRSVPYDVEELNHVLFEYFGIREGGFTEIDTKYIEVLREHGKPLGIDTISKLIHVPKTVIQGEIEPFLFSKKLATITTRGRIAL